ncbi:MAG: calcium/sodium antiporter [Candidatus Delongbacteria bacterium]|nr:calcium/sodium antiporter [Candidatus Delongbacteria bacterium]MBN2836992.1 calcium/sodium antiporter [Candidatus Delongbacteria bacterium]
MFLSYILFATGFILVVKGADYLISGSSGFSKSFGINPLFIGLTVVAFGTSLPEFVVSMIDSLGDSKGIALGNIVGSNIANIALILGFVAILKPIDVQKRVYNRDMPIVLFVSFVFYMMMLDGQIGRLDGLILVVFFIFYILYIYRKAKVGEEDLDEPDDVEVDNTKNTLKVIGGLVALYFGADMLISNASEIARNLGISELIIGLTMVAVGTSLPELVTTLQALRKNEHDIGVGGIVGSNIFNVLFVIGIVTLITPINVDQITISQHGPFMLAIAILFYPLTFVAKRIERWAGVIFLSLYLGYTVYNFV